MFQVFLKVVGGEADPHNDEDHKGTVSCKLCITACVDRCTVAL